ncbi:MAG: N-acetyltransferase, partial [Desulfofundulus sp.]
MSLKVIRVQNMAQFSSFLGLAELIYGRNSRTALANRRETVFLFDPRTNPTLHHVRLALFLALQNERPVGRIACAVDEYCREETTGFFGAFEAVPDEQIALALLEAAGRWLQGEKCRRMVGPATVNTNQRVGLLIEGFSAPPAFALPYNPPYYQELFENCRCKKLTDLLAFQWLAGEPLPEEIKRVARRARRYAGTKVYPLNAGLPLNR